MKIAVSILATKPTGTFKIWKCFLFSGLGTELPETQKLFLTIITFWELFQLK